MQHMSTSKLKNYLKHLCIATKHYSERENARTNLELHLKKVKKSSDLQKDLSELNKKVNFLFDKELKVASLGKSKNLPATVLRKIKLLEQELNITKNERRDLDSENVMLRKTIDELGKLTSSFQEVKNLKEKTNQRVEDIEKRVDKKYDQILVKEIKNKILTMEDSLKEIAKDHSIHPNKIYALREKLQKYKQLLKGKL